MMLVNTLPVQCLVYCKSLFILNRQISIPQVAQSNDTLGKVAMPSTSKEDLPKDEDSVSGIPRSLSDSTHPLHLLPTIDGMNTYPAHKRHASLGTTPGRMFPTHARSSSMDKRYAYEGFLFQNISMLLKSHVK